MAVLDRRLSKTQQHQTVGLVAKKVRRVGEPSSQPPPPDAPVWAVKKDPQEAMQGVLACLSHLCVQLLLYAAHAHTQIPTRKMMYHHPSQESE